MHRTRNSLYNALSAIMLTISNGLLGLIVTQNIIRVFGSDFNGLNSTATQLVNMMLVLEGGFTLAANVAIFKPYVEKDYFTIHRIIVAVKKRFQQIGLLFLCVGIFISFIYSNFVNSMLPQDFVLLVFVMTVFPSAINLFFVLKYRVMLQAEQKEYVISLITLVTVSLGHITNLILINTVKQIGLIRLITMVYSLINSIIISIYCRKKYKMFDFSVEPDFAAIKGTKEVFIQKITGVIYSTLPIVSISISGGGTLLASVYAVYNSIFALLKSILYAVIDAPRLGLGQVIAENDKERTYQIYVKYETLVVIILFILLSTTAVLLMPFIMLYTAGVSDVDYRSYFIGGVLMGITFFEIIHIPSGHVINMAGFFKVSRQFQTSACGLLVIGMFFGNQVGGFRGILSGVLVTAIFLAILEIHFTHCIFFEKKLYPFIRTVFLNCIVSAILICMESIFISLRINNYLDFVVFGFCSITINSFLFILFNYILNYEIMMELVQYAKRIFYKK
ncbi:hypothetical protein [Clostridium transplantifaecale]|uniref:hypothetical protein n=1 Tax=Clostridium transplantifaecale TaxID=2479838 RepID=UPI000F62C273|nr:hypothetical protein [Clostridium transplantifaecale]